MTMHFSSLNSTLDFIARPRPRMCGTTRNVYWLFSFFFSPTKTQLAGRPPPSPPKIPIPMSTPFPSQNTHPMLSFSPLSSPLGILCHNQLIPPKRVSFFDKKKKRIMKKELVGGTYFVEDEGENGMRRDPQEMGGCACEQRVSRQPQCALRNEGGNKKKKNTPLYHPAIPSALNVFQRQSKGFV